MKNCDNSRANLSRHTILIHVIIENNLPSGLTDKHRWNENIRVVRRRHDFQLVGVFVVDNNSIEAGILGMPDFIYKTRKVCYQTSLAAAAIDSYLQTSKFRE